MISNPPSPVRAVPKILVVEDEVITAKSIKEDLLLSGYEVLAIAATGEEAIRIAGELQPDLILMDITLSSSMSGIEAAAEIVKFHPIPIVFLTADSDPQTTEKAKQISAFGFLPKPCTKATMISTIEMALFKNEADTKTKHLLQKAFDKAMASSAVKLDDAHIAFKVLLEQWKLGQGEAEQIIQTNIKKLIYPALQALENTRLTEGQKVMVSSIIHNLQLLSEEQLSASGGQLSLLSSTESQVAHYVKAGKSTKEIAQFLNIAASTINTHRDSIRKKLGIKNTKTNLKKELQKML